MRATGKISGVRRVEAAVLPPGQFPAVWSGKVIKVAVGDVDYRMNTKMGVRGRVPGSVVVGACGEVRWSDDVVEWGGDAEWHHELAASLDSVIDRWCPDCFAGEPNWSRAIRALLNLAAYEADCRRAAGGGAAPIRTDYPLALPVAGGADGGEAVDPEESLDRVLRKLRSQIAEIRKGLNGRYNGFIDSEEQGLQFAVDVVEAELM